MSIFKKTNKQPMLLGRSYMSPGYKNEFWHHTNSNNLLIPLSLLPIQPSLEIVHIDWQLKNKIFITFCHKYKQIPTQENTTEKVKCEQTPHLLCLLAAKVCLSPTHEWSTQIPTKLNINEAINCILKPTNPYGKHDKSSQMQKLNLIINVALRIHQKDNILEQK